MLDSETSPFMSFASAREGDSLFRRVVEAAPSAMVMINTKGEIEMVNAQAELVFGYSRAEMLGQTVEMLVPHRFRGQHPGLRHAFAHDPATRPMGAGRDLYALRKDGSEFPVEIGLNPLVTDEGPKILSAIVDISDRKAKERRIEQALMEKNLLLSEIHHRVKNNLQVVHSLIDLQSAQISDAGVQAMMRDLQNRVHSMAMIHQTLYQSQDFAKVDFGEFLEHFVPALISSYALDSNQIAISTEANGTAMPLNAAIPCGLIINELVSNALKHAFPEGRDGKLEVELSRDTDGWFHLEVRDNGIGMPSDFDPRRSTSLGLQLVDILASQLGGRFEIGSGSQTIFVIRFPGPRQGQQA